MTAWLVSSLMSTYVFISLRIITLSTKDSIPETNAFRKTLILGKLLNLSVSSSIFSLILQFYFLLYAFVAQSCPLTLMCSTPQLILELIAELLCDFSFVLKFDNLYSAHFRLC